MSFKIDSNNVQYSKSNKDDLKGSINKFSNQLRNKNISDDQATALADDLNNMANSFKNELKQKIVLKSDDKSDDILNTLKTLATSQINIKAAESQLRDVDFSKEVEDFKKDNILTKSGSYRKSQSLDNNKVMNLLK